MSSRSLTINTTEDAIPPRTTRRGKDLNVSAQNQAQSVSIALEQIQHDASIDGYYYNKISIGQQSDEFPVLFDTGSFNLAVPGKSCGTAQGCYGPVKYQETGIALVRIVTMAECLSVDVHR